MNQAGGRMLDDSSTKIAFVGSRTGKKEIYVADADGAGVHQLTNDGTISVGPRPCPKSSAREVKSQYSSSDSPL